MYCPKCKINTGKEKFCENCGTATVEKLESNNSQGYDPRVEHPETKSLKDFKPSVPKMSVKKIITLCIVAMIGIATLVGYNGIKASLQPKAIAEKYVKSLTAGENEKAFAMLDIEKSQFVNEDYFDKYVKELGMEGKEIKEVRESGMENKVNDFLMNNSGQVKEKLMTFEAQMNDDIYKVKLIKKGKKYGMFDEWKICSKDLIKDWNIIAPRGANVLVDGTKIERIEESQNVGFFKNAIYNPENRSYVIDGVFPLEYEVAATMEGAKEVKFKANSNSNQTVSFDPTDQVVKELKSVSEKFFNIYYSNEDKKSYKGVVSPKSKFLKEKNKSSNSFKAYNLRKLEELEVLESAIDDKKHATVMVNVKFSYESEETNFFTREKKKVTGNSTEIVNFSFEKKDGKWIIVDTGIFR